MVKSSVDDRWSSTRLALKKIGPHDPGQVPADSWVINRREATVAATWPRTLFRESSLHPVDMIIEPAALEEARALDMTNRESNEAHAP
jgi:hypothetical protein